MLINKIIDEINSINEIRELEILKNKIEKRLIFILNSFDENKQETIRVKIKQIDYKGTGKSWVSIIDENLKNVKFIKKHFLRKEKNRFYFYLNLPFKNVYLINQEGSKSMDEKYYLFVDEYGTAHRINFNNKEEVKSLIKELIEY